MQAGPLGFCAVERPATLAAETYLPLREFRSCDISDAMNKSHTMSGIRAAHTASGTLIGPAITVSVPGSGFQMIAAAMTQARPGDVLVIDTHGGTEAAYWGGFMSELAASMQIAGVVVDGGLRDQDEIESIAFPAFSRTFATRVATDVGPYGEINMPIACGGVVVNPGDIVVADVHGVVAVPSAWVERVIHDTQALVSGEVVFDPAQLRQALAAQGLLTVATPGG